MIEDAGCGFTCNECDHYFPTLDGFERHIWNRHIQNFPYRCAVCGYPSLNLKDFDKHFQMAHGDAHPPEFKRKMEDESRLWTILTDSINNWLYASVYNGDVDGYAQQGPAPVPYGRDETREDGECREAADADRQKPPTVWQVDDASDDRFKIVARRVASPAVKRIPSNWMQEEISVRVAGQPQQLNDGGTVVLMGGLRGDEMEPMMSVAAEEEVFQEDQADDGREGEHHHHHDGDDDGQMMMSTPGPSYVEYYEQPDAQGFVDDTETYEFVDTDGNPLYLDPEFSSKAVRELRLRMLKDGIPPKSPRPPKKDGHRCDICGKVDKFRSKAIEHRRSHTGEKPFKCPKCKMGFTQRGALKSHLRLHTGERPYACTWDCGKTFPSSSACKSHEKSHAGEMNYPCDFCGRLFAKRYHVERHVKALHIRPQPAGGPPGSSSSAISNPPLKGLAAAEEDEPSVRTAVLSVIEAVRADKQAKADKLTKQ
ncbi:unnamed protein product, partial [Mesorhabditis spiculigera]